jgi:hypothetical protein
VEGSGEWDGFAAVPCEFFDAGFARATDTLQRGLMSPVIKLDLNLSPEEFLEAQGDALRRPGMQEVARQALEQAGGLVSPALVYDWLPVGAREAQTAEVGGALFHLGRHADLLGQAQLAFVAVLTIGPSLEEQARVLQGSGRALDSFILGEAGVFVVGKLIAEAHRVVEAEAADRGWGVGAELAPGQLAGWAIAEQKLLCGLLDVEAIGVRVTESGMLVPQKSASMMVGIGTNYESTEVRSPCAFCDLGETCRFRH